MRKAMFSLVSAFWIFIYRGGGNLFDEPQREENKLWIQKHAICVIPSMKAKLQDTYGMAIKVYKFLRFGGMFTNGGIAGC